jgi:hypothetical protein
MGRGLCVSREMDRRLSLAMSYSSVKATTSDADIVGGGQLCSCMCCVEVPQWEGKTTV